MNDGLIIRLIEKLMEKSIVLLKDESSDQFIVRSINRLIDRLIDTKIDR